MSPIFTSEHRSTGHMLQYALQMSFNSYSVSIVMLAEKVWCTPLAYVSDDQRAQQNDCRRDGCPRKAGLLTHMSTIYASSQASFKEDRAVARFSYEKESMLALKVFPQRDRKMAQPLFIRRGDISGSQDGVRPSVRQILPSSGDLLRLMHMSNSTTY